MLCRPSTQTRISKLIIQDRTRLSGTFSAAVSCTKPLKTVPIIPEILVFEV